MLLFMVIDLVILQVMKMILKTFTTVKLTVIAALYMKGYCI